MLTSKEKTHDDLACLQYEAVSANERRSAHSHFEDILLEKKETRAPAVSNKLYIGNVKDKYKNGVKRRPVPYQ
jgi:hypothetical protein